MGRGADSSALTFTPTTHFNQIEPTGQVGEREDTNMDYIERRKLIDILKNTNSIQELIALFEDNDTGYQNYYSVSAVKDQIHEASRIIKDCERQDKMYLIIDYDVLNAIINCGGAGRMDQYRNTIF